MNLHANFRILLLAAMAGIGFFVSCSGTGKADTREILHYVNPMNPAVISDKPMKDSMGMDYIPVYKDDGAREVHGGAGTKDPREISNLTLSVGDENKISVRTTPVEYRKFVRQVKTVGRITYNEQLWEHVSARFGGRVEVLHANYTGMPVEAGQPLLEIYSPALVTAQQEMLQFHRLVSRETTPLNRNLFEASRSKIRLWGIPERQVDEILASGEPLYAIPVPSPITGTVIAKNITSGMYVSEGEMLFEIADLREVWAEIDLYEQDAGKAGMGDTLEMTLPAYPATVFRGKITFISPVLDTATRTIKVRGNFPNDGNLLKPNMYAEVTLRSSGDGETLVVPDSALLDTGKRKIVYVSLGNGKYAGRRVVLGDRSAGYVSILSGLEEGERVVTHGAFLMDSQAQLAGNSYIHYDESVR